MYEIEQTLVVKTRSALSKIGPEIARAVESLGPGRPVFEIKRMEDIMRSSIDGTRFTMLVLAGFAGAALLLTGVGLYSTLAYLVSQRTQEFGVRLALGATPSNLVRLVGHEGVLLTAIGTTVGLIVATGVTQAIRGLLYDVSTHDDVTLVAVVVLVGIVALTAVSVPALRASRVDPVTALRSD
jgi:ABC-type antimicrobial peptide transport system permease subunit